MAGLTPLPLYEFRRSLRARGESIETLADAIGACRRAVSQTLNDRIGGEHIWPRIRAAVTPSEWATLLQLKHCSAWNMARKAEGPAAQVWAMRAVCAWCGGSMGFRSCVMCEPGEVTHGICPACYEATLAEAANDISGRGSALTGAPCGELSPTHGDPSPGRKSSYLVRTEAGLQVHQAPADTPPALADDRKFTQPEGPAHFRQMAYGTWPTAPKQPQRKATA